MFFVGDTSQAAAFYLDEVRNHKGHPKVPDKPLEELTVKELRRWLTLTWMAYDKAKKDGAHGAALDPMLQTYKNAYIQLGKKSAAFRDYALDEGRAFHPAEFRELLSES